MTAANVAPGASLGARLEAGLARRLHTTRRAACEYALIALAFYRADPTPTSLAVGAGVAACGEALRITTAGYGYKVGELTMRGPYRFVRHPYFLGTALIVVGIALGARDVYAVAAAIVGLTLMFRWTMALDEARWERFLGPAFARYRVSVPAFVPRLWGVRAEPDNRGFSLQYAVFRGRHRELDALIALALAFGLLWVSSYTTRKALWHGAVLATAVLYPVVRFLYYSRARRYVAGA
jgi:hypothetical protein